MKKIIKAANLQYKQLTLGNFFDAYHDYMYDMLKELESLEENEIDHANEILKKIKAIIKAQRILNNVNIK